jgi:hypothetical protein
MENVSYVIQIVHQDVQLQELENVILVVQLIGLSILSRKYVLKMMLVQLQIVPKPVVQQLMPQNVLLVKMVTGLMLEFVKHVLL